MNFSSIFKSITNFQFPYTIDEGNVVLETPLWQVFDGTRKADSLPVTIFKAQVRGDTSSLIANAIHKAKILRIPGLCNVLETFDSDPQSTFIITERVTPFNWAKIGDYSKNKDAIYLWVSQLVTTLKYMKSFVLGALNKESLFFNSKGELVVFGLELCSNIDDSYHFSSMMKPYYSICRLTPPASEDPTIVDSLLLGNLLKNDLLKRTGIPRDWNPLISSLCSGKYKIAQFADKMENTDTWQTNPMIDLYTELKELHIKDMQGKIVVLNNLEGLFFEDKAMFNNMGPGFIENLILPEITELIQLLIKNGGNGISSGHSKIVSFLSILLELTVEYKCYTDSFKDTVALSFKLPDRQVRFLLLMFLPHLIEPFGTTDVCNRIYPQFTQGLSDSEPKLRLETLKKVPCIVPCLNERQLNNELLRYLAKTQVDSDIEIRTWTVFIITRISNELSSSMGNRASILATAFTKSLKDPDIKPRLAALHGLTETIDLFDAETIATKVLSVIAPSFMDRDKLVRDKARELFKRYISKLEDEASVLDGDADESSSTPQIDFQAYECDNDSELLSQFLENLKLGSSSSSSLHLMKARSNNNSNISIPEDLPKTERAERNVERKERNVERKERNVERKVERHNVERKVERRVERPAERRVERKVIRKQEKKVEVPWEEPEVDEWDEW
ncbi:Cytoplasmic export protein 1 [Nakaseomyces bracarensis]|uniref:Cytoplasmic export protein 1 n=1 Tax=Nakaseomyces bracarensis TaxID=273131 RepID=A0ABR4NLZ7_9SACH